MPNEVTKLPDGRISAKLETGEIFEGDALEVTQKMAEAHVSTKRWGQEWKQKAETNQAPPQPNQSPADPQQEATDKWLAERTSKGLLGSTPEEIRKEWEEIKTFKQQMQTNNAITQFYQMHPEYPGSQTANDIVGKIMEERNWPLTADNLEAAHLTAVQKKMYEPLSAEAVNSTWANNMASASRQTPPPMLRGNNPEQMSGGMDPNTMPLNDLRKMAISQELNRK